MNDVPGKFRLVVVSPGGFNIAIQQVLPTWSNVGRGHAAGSIGHFLKTRRTETACIRDIPDETDFPKRVTLWGGSNYKTASWARQRTSGGGSLMVGGLAHREFGYVLAGMGSDPENRVERWPWWDRL